jgi:ubiquinone/menaquinone biosynthesis C-methylase UbiE
MSPSVVKIRERLAKDHISTPYYGEAERPDRLDIFWAAGIFRDRFDQLDLTRVVELACGHGRHTAQFVNRAESVTLVDVVAQNIEACRARFAGRLNVAFLVNDGTSLRGIADSSATAVFSYDSMVHFEAMDIISYLNEIGRVLCPGGRALLHYSNCEDFPEGTYIDQQHWRNFFSEKMMRHFGSRSGFKILSSQTTPWPPSHVNAPRIDAVTLLEKL